MMLRVWYRLSLRMMKLYPSNRLKVAIVAPFWVNYFGNKIGIEKVFLYPNFFDNTYYKGFVQENKKDKVDKY